MQKFTVKSVPALAGLSAALLLAACGGGGDAPPASGGGAGAVGGSLTISAATPAANNTTLNLDGAAVKGNDARPADSFSSSPYCDVYFEGFTGANGTTYALQVYFRQSDKAPLNASIVGGSGAAFWAVFDNNSGNPITGVSVDATARTITFTSKVLNGSSGETATVNGTLTFPANATAAACGA